MFLNKQAVGVCNDEKTSTQSCHQSGSGVEVESTESDASRRL